jgi:uncharacterized protein (DUF305 family)
MKKNKNNILILAIVAIVAIAGMVLFAVTGNNDGKMNGGMMSNNNSSQDSSNGLVDKNSADYKMYSELTGDDYDRMFIANMIEHHKGAVDMAKLAQANAKHQELKDMAGAIIAAQSKEITDMETWQKEWGYPSSSGEMMMDHSATE